MSKETNLNAAENNHIFTGKVEKMYKRISFVLAAAMVMNLFAMAAPAIAAFVPDVVGMTREQAESKINSSPYFAVGVIWQSHNGTVPSGRVISQDPAGGTWAGYFTHVDLVISLGPETVEVPDVVGMSWSEAFQAIYNAGLGPIHKSYVCSSTVPNGHIISQAPAAGTEVDVGSLVTVLISTGPCPLVQVPDVVGMAYDEARSAIISAGLLDGVNWVYSGSVAEGLIISQDPPAGIFVKISSYVILTKSAGTRPLVEVPDVVGMTLADGSSEIHSVGIGGFSAHIYEHSETIPDGHIISTDPVAGNWVPIGNYIDVTISRGPAPPVEVPDVVGMSESDATSAINSAELSVGGISSEYSNSVPENHVISQNPAAGTSVPPGSAVDLTISLGPLPVEVPDVVGMARATAESAITAAGLSVGTISYEYSNSVPEGHVIIQDPAAGTSVPPGSGVDLVISLGPWTVPDVVGMSESDAASAINSAELSVGSMGYLYSDTVPAGSVISSYPAAGTVVDPGSKVDLDMSMGPDTGGPTVEVPDVVGMTESDAKSVITSESLNVGTISNDYSDSVPKGFVISQYPAGGTEVSEGYSVLLTISLGPEPVDVPPVPVPPDASCLLAHWNLDGGSGNSAIDSSGNGFDITLHNTTWEDGVFGGAVHFHGVGYGDVWDFNYSENAITLCAWVWHDEFRFGKIERYVTVGQSVAVIRKEYDGRLHFYIGTDGNFRHLWVNNVLTGGQWHHIAGTWDGLTQRLYIDGVEIASQTPGGVLGNTSYVMISSTMDEAFNGMLDDVHIYSYGLSESEIRAVMAGAGTIVPSESKDIGTTGGSDIYEDGVYTIVANGNDIWDNRDEFRYVYAPVSGDFEVSARVLSLENTNGWAKAGVMVRETLDPRARNAFMFVTPEQGEGRLSFQSRSMGTGEMTTSFHTVPGQVFYPINTRVKIRRQGSTFTSFISEDGIVWEEFPGMFLTDSPGGSNPVTIEMPETVYVGLAVTSHSVGTLCMAEFDDVVIRTTGGTTPPPSPPPPDPLSEALDTSLRFTTGGSADWFSQSTTSYYNGDAAQSGDISDEQESWMQTTVSGKGTVKFYWKVSSEEHFDSLEFYIDGVLEEQISGSVNWQKKIYAISTSGSHTLEWRYMKDGATDLGSDCGWVDKVEWVNYPLASTFHRL